MNTNQLKIVGYQSLQSFNKALSRVAIVFSSFTFISIANASDYYVATTGSDTYTGIQAQKSATPWKTIQKAADTVPTGSTVHVAPGNYPGTLVIKRGGTSEATRISFVSNTKWGAKMLGTAKLNGDDGNNMSAGAVEIYSSSFVTLEGFDISTQGRPPGYYNGITIIGHNDIGSTNLIIKGNYIHDINTATDHGLGVDDQYYYPGSDGNSRSRNNQIINNFITRTDGYGVYISTYQATIANNLIVDVGRYGIHLWHAANQATIANNTIINVHRGIPTDPEHQSSVGIIIGAGDSPWDGSEGSYAPVTNNGTKVFNNIIAGTLDGGIEEHCNSSFPGGNCTGKGNIYKTNLFYSVGSWNYSLKNGLTGGGTVVADLKLLNVTNSLINDLGKGDYHLKADSPAINAGTTANAPTTDHDGVVRIGNPDIGAYEYVDSAKLNPQSNLQTTVQLHAADNCW